ncbi:MAG: MMPL family transporter [Candidatus ainarchaeum sp.]|nr:MMPL family transporter [Candidatus ainarchaeum sp.]
MKIVNNYSRFLAHHPWTILLVGLLLTGLFIYGATLVQMESIDYSKAIPSNYKEIKAFNFIKDEFGTTGSALTFVIRLDEENGESEINDIRDVKVLNYINLISEKSKKISGISSVSSLSTLLKSDNAGILPKSNEKIVELINNAKVINPQTIDVVNSLNQTSGGINQINTSLNQTTGGLTQISQGVDASSKGVAQISVVLEKISSALGQEQDFSSINQLVLLTTQLDSLIDASVNPLDPNYTNMKRSVAIIKAGLEQTYMGLEESSAGLKTTSNILDQSSTALDKISTGLNQANDGTKQIIQYNEKMSLGLMNINQGLNGISQYISFTSAEYTPGKKTIINQYPGYLSTDYSTTIIRLNLDSMSKTEEIELVNELDQILNETVVPNGITSGYTGSIKLSEEMQNSIGPTMTSTSIISIALILIIVSILFFSLRKGIISLFAIIFGTIWTFGIMGLTGSPINSIMSGALSMIMGIGIDFGIQIVNRFNQEKLKNNTEEAMINTIKNTWSQMLITTLAALIGFRAMSMGEITIIADLGNMMGLGVLSCYLIAMTIIPAILVLNDKITLENIRKIVHQDKSDNTTNVKQKNKKVKLKK